MKIDFELHKPPGNIFIAYSCFSIPKQKTNYENKKIPAILSLLFTLSNLHIGWYSLFVTYQVLMVIVEWTKKLLGCESSQVDYY